MCNILIFAGTTEGRQLGEFCTKNKIHSYISVATAYGETLIGGAEYLHILTGRMTSSDCAMESLKADNRNIINGFQHEGEQVVLIDSDYEQTLKALLV